MLKMGIFHSQSLGRQIARRGVVLRRRGCDPSERLLEEVDDLLGRVIRWSRGREMSEEVLVEGVLAAS